LNLKFIDKHFVVTGSFDEMVVRGGKDIPKGAGFQFRPEGKEPVPRFAIWFTDDPSIAVALIKYATPKAKARLIKMEEEQTASRKASRAVKSDIHVPVPDGLEYRPFQLAGIEFALGRPNTLFGDEMGLGKTMQAIGVINAQGAIIRTLVVCPATLKLNWKNELEKWLVRQPQTVEVAYANKPFPRASTVIINFDILGRMCKCEDKVVSPECPLHSETWGVLIVDECHFVKNPKTQRSKAVKAIKAKQRLYLTGTPIVNRPVELWPIISVLDPDTFNHFWTFAKRYCNARNNGFGWDLKGSSNLPELQQKLRSSIMVRRLKSEVLKELPPKVRQVIEIPYEGKAVKAEGKAMAAVEDKLATLKVAVELAKASDDPEEYAAAVKALRAGFMVAFTEMAQVRHDTAVAKIPYVIEHIKSALEAEHKVVCFVHHHDVADALMEEFKGQAVELTGRTSQVKRQENIDSFQNDKRVRVFVGSIQAAGVGITLTAASHVIFAELDWVPGNVTQAEDRLHRIGQRGSVLVQHLVLEGSIDAAIAKTMVEKQAVIDRALDSKDRAEVKAEPVLPIPQSTGSTSRKRIAEEAEKLTPTQVEAVHAALKYLTSLDSDRAAILNAAGFSKIDSDIGHSLAATARLSPRQAALGKRIVTKYRRQLEPGLVAAVRGESDD
jgi:SWI/SNF-related matrix-associated actin-dependent regulator 1 of chromatin subfamily A